MTPASYDPPIIAYLRDRLAAYDAAADPASAAADPASDIVATVTGGVPRALGVSAQKVAERFDGTSVYVLTAEETRRAVEKFDAAPGELAAA